MSNTIDYRVYLIDSQTNKKISPWHSISFNTQNLFHYINEIPFNTTAKFEISTTENLNPIKQDINKKDKSYSKIPFNQGVLSINYSTKLVGDSDPIDCIEISHFSTKLSDQATHQSLKTGDVLRIKILGCLALIDEGETDWKLIVISDQSDVFGKLKEVSDINRVCCNKLLESIKH